MYGMSTKDYADTIRTCFNKKVPLFVYGGPGIGKSEIPRQVFQDMASKIGTHKEINAKTGKERTVKGKIFVEWNDTSKAEKLHMIANADDYFVFCDQRVGQMDSTDLRGIPNMMNPDMLETVPMSWVIYFTQKLAHGAIFFDELNLAAPTVAGQAYQIINERCVSDRVLGDDVFVFGAGNRAQDQAHTFDMPFPLKDRFCEFEISPNTEDWTEWATGNVNGHLVAFIQWKESYLYNVSANKANKSSTPRGIVRASRLLGDIDITTDEAFALVSISCGEGFAAEFQAYCKHFKSLNWDTIYKKPQTVKDFQLDKLWAIVGGMSEQYNKFDKLTGKDAAKTKSKQFSLMMNVILEMKDEFAVVGLRLMKDSNAKKFGQLLKNDKRFDDIVGKYAEYIID